MSIASRPTSDGQAVPGAWSSQPTVDPHATPARRYRGSGQWRRRSAGRTGRAGRTPRALGLGHSRVHRLFPCPAAALRPGGAGHRPVGVIPFPHGARIEILIALAIFFILLTAAFILPWERLPNWMWLVIPIGYMGVIAADPRRPGRQSESELVIVYILPIVWISLYGRRLHLLVGLLCMDLALMVPVLLVGLAQLPHSRVAPGDHPHRGDHPGGRHHRVHGPPRPAVRERPGPAVACWPAATPRTPTTPATGWKPSFGRPPAAPSWGSTRAERSPSSPPGPSSCSGYSAARGGRHPLHHRLHRPGPDRRAPADDRRHAQRTRPGSTRGGGRGPLDGQAQERRVPPLRGAGAHPPHAGGRRTDRPAGLRAAATWWWPSTSPSARSWPPSASASTPFRRR